MGYIMAAMIKLPEAPMELLDIQNPLLPLQVPMETPK